MYTKTMNFNNKKVMISGASRGIGEGIAYTFAAHGANLVLLDLEIQQEQLQKVKGSLEAEFNVEVANYSMDLTKYEQIERVVKQINEEQGEIDILINNAGTNNYCDATQVTEQIWDSIVDLNLKGTFFLTQQVAIASLLRREGIVVSIASQHGVIGNTKRAPYCASKGGIVNMTKALAYEWAKYNVRVNCVSPTFVITESNKAMLQESAFKRKALNQIPLKRYATPEDVAYAVLFLASEMATMITGHNILVDGGWTSI